MTSLAKSYSVELKQKPNSHTKLPKLEKTQQKNQPKIRTSQFQALIKKNNALQRLSEQTSSLYNKRGNSMNSVSMNSKSKVLTQQNEILQSRQKNNRSIIRLKPINYEQFKVEDQKVLENELKKKINLDTKNMTDTKTDSAGSSRASLHPVVNQIQSLLSEQAKKFMLPVKSYNQSQIGEVSAIWWCVVDSLFVSLQKILKVRQTQQPSVSPEKDTKSPQKTKQNQKQSPGKGDKVKKEVQKQTKNISGIVESNTKVSLQLTKVYCCLQQQNRKNQQTIIKYYQDPNHIILILQALFYEKAVMYLLGTIRKWNHHQQLLYIHSLAIDLILCIVQCRKLMMDILLQAVENQQQDNKIRKPKYIARQKKLIQISKFTTMMKGEYQKYLNSLGSPHRYKIFQFPQTIKDHSNLDNLEQKWRNFVFQVPLYPYLLQKQGRKEYLLILEPLNFLYKYNKKEQSLQIDPYAELFLKTVNQYFDIVMFTCVDKQASLLNFLGILDKAQIAAILDKHHLTYLSAKPIKDIAKVGGGYSKDRTLVIDQKSNTKYYLGCKYHLFLADGNHYQTKIVRVNGKLVKLQDNDEDYLKKLSQKIIRCIEKGGNFQNITHEKHEKIQQQDRRK